MGTWVDLWGLLRPGQHPDSSGKWEKIKEYGWRSEWLAERRS